MQTRRQVTATITAATTLTAYCNGTKPTNCGLVCTVHNAAPFAAPRFVATYGHLRASTNALCATCWPHKAAREAERQVCAHHRCVTRARPRDCPRVHPAWRAPHFRRGQRRERASKPCRNHPSGWHGQDESGPSRRRPRHAAWSTGGCRSSARRRAWRHRSSRQQRGSRRLEAH